MYTQFSISLSRKSNRQVAIYRTNDMVKAGARIWLIGRIAFGSLVRGMAVVLINDNCLARQSSIPFIRIHKG